MDRIEARDFTFCQAFFSNPYGVRTFVVMTPSKTQARRRAAVYAGRRFEQEPTKILLYPRTYVKDARELYAAGKHD